jgi:phosphoserine phosphatase RsbU/P
MAPARARELRIHTPDGQTKTIQLQGDRLTVGRSSTTELCFADDAGLSRQHLAFEREGDEWNVLDLASKNGTLLNSMRLNGAMRLRPGDRVAAGHLVMVYDDPGNKAVSSPVTFVPGAEGEGPTSSTVVVDLKKLMGGKGVDTTTAVQMRALIKAGEELSLQKEKKSLTELFQLILDLSIEAVGAERGILMTLENNDELVVRAAKGNAFRISTTVRDRVVKTRLSVLVRDTMLDEAFRERQSIIGQSVRTLMAAPLQTKDRTIGLIYVDSPSLTRVFKEDDLNLLTFMANTAAIRIEHERLAEIEHQERMMAHELEQAAEIQQRFLPAKAPVLAGLDLAGHNAPCRTVGGDYYDFFPYENGRVARVQVLIEEPENLGAVLTRLNRLTAINCPSNRFITFFMCLLDGATGDLVFANAGHNPPLVMRASGQAEWLEAGGCVLGIIPVMKYDESRSCLGAGDVLVVFSDGVTDALNPQGEDFGEERLAEAVRKHRAESSAAILEGVNQAIAEWAAGTPLPDDLTLLVARRKG